MNNIQKYIPIGLLSAFTLKVMVSGANLSEMGIILGLAAILGFKDYLEKKETILEVRTQCEKSIKDIEAVVKTQNEVIEKLAKAMDEQRTYIASTRMAQNLKSGISGVR